MANAFIRRLVHGAAAGSFGQAVTIGGQLVSVPLLLAAWGPQVYGDWLLLTAAPWLLSFLDLGLVQAASNRITAMVAAGEEAAARRLLDAAWSWLLALAMILAALTAIALPLVDVPASIGVEAIPAGDAGSILALAILWVLLGLPAGSLQCSFRGQGRYAEGTWWYHGGRAGELAASLVAAWLWGPVAAALALVAMRAAAGLAMFARVGQLPWPLPTMRMDAMATIRPLLAPALASVGLTAANVISLHGTLLVLGAHLDSAACAQYATLRTLCRVPIQFGNVALWPLQHETARLLGTDDTAAVRRIWRRTTLWSGIGACAAGAGLWCAGPWVFAIWTHGALAWDGDVAALLVIGATGQCLWGALAVPCIAGNRHGALAIAGMTSGLAVLLILAVLLPAIPRIGVAAALAAAADLALCVVALGASGRTLAVGARR